MSLTSRLLDGLGGEWYQGKGTSCNTRVTRLGSLSLSHCRNRTLLCASPFLISKARTHPLDISHLLNMPLKESVPQSHRELSRELAPLSLCLSGFLCSFCDVKRDIWSEIHFTKLGYMYIVIRIPHLT